MYCLPAILRPVMHVSVHRHGHNRHGEPHQYVAERSQHTRAQMVHMTRPSFKNTFAFDKPPNREALEIWLPV